MPASVAEAKTMQQSLRHRVRLENAFSPIRHVAGVDVGYDKACGMAHASVAVVDARTLMPIEQRQCFIPVDFPYIPGLLSFREIPAILAALDMLSTGFEMLMVDGQGIAHPRRLGIAAHLGVLVDMPAIGVAKSRLTGTFTEPAAHKGSRSSLMDGAERIGTVLRSKTNVAPLFISPGHRIDLPTSLRLVEDCLTRYRLPEPTRLADKFSKIAPAGKAA
ncbi:MAG: deoxyribonuclease V [Rickettsiales bacterium]|nr:deoxyribonuclease V [Rickettsiales bacterium]